MKVKEFIKELQKYNQEAEILLGCDEELNTIFKDVQCSYLGDSDEDNSQVVLWGNSGSELDDMEDID
jgi:hypothetical protein